MTSPAVPSPSCRRVPSPSCRCVPSPPYRRRLSWLCRFHPDPLAGCPPLQLFFVFSTPPPLPKQVFSHYIAIYRPLLYPAQNSLAKIQSSFIFFFSLSPLQRGKEKEKKYNYYINYTVWPRTCRMNASPNMSTRFAPLSVGGDDLNGGLKYPEKTNFQAAATLFYIRFLLHQ